MKNGLLITIIFSMFMGGCDTLRFAPTEAQKENTWVHNRTVQLAAETARMENTSSELQQLTSLSAVQSGAFLSYYGMPKKRPLADTAEDILAESNWQLARTALRQSAERPDVWELADSFFDIGILVAALFGGVYGTKAVGFMKQAREKSKALREIVIGNELFKSRHPEVSPDFKAAHKNQSSQTRQLVA